MLVRRAVDVSIEIRVRFRDGERRDERDRREDAGRRHHRMAAAAKSLSEKVQRSREDFAKIDGKRDAVIRTRS